MDLGLQKADEVAAKFGTRNVFEIARLSEVSLFYERWYPVTIGEFEKRKRAIWINLRAAESGVKFEKIIAHELGHFFASDLKLEKKEEETFARAFAERMLENNR